MKLSTFWFVGTTAILLLDSGSFVLGAKKLTNKCKAIGDGKGEVDKSVCQDNEKCERKKEKCVNVNVKKANNLGKCEPPRNV